MNADLDTTDLDSLTSFEREVYDLAVAALSLPMTPRAAWLRGKALELTAAGDA